VDVSADAGLISSRHLCNIAFGAMTACRENDLVVGRDVSVKGYSKSPMASFCDPAQTSVEHRVLKLVGIRERVRVGN
jgi:hypothetical protein